jgi:hypothetical protein
MMSNPDDRAFDVYLARGSNLSQRYRDEATDKPSAAVDSLILTASRRAKVSMAEMTVVPWYKRWRVPIAFAAVLVLGVGVTLRTVLQESKLAEPPPVAPMVKPESAPAPAAPESSDNKAAADAASPPASAVMGGALSTPKDASPDNELAKKKSSAPEEIVIEKEAPQAFPPSSAPIPPEQAIPGRALPEPSAGAAPGKGTVESQTGSGSSGSVLNDVRPSQRQEQDTQADKSVSEVEKRDEDVVARRRDQAPPKAAEEAAPPASAPVEAEVNAKPLDELDDGPRLPEGHAPVVDGKTFRSNSAELKREAEEKSKQRAAAAIVDDVTEAPEAWLRRVAELRRTGRTEEAKVELEKFRKRYPDYPAPVER